VHTRRPPCDHARGPYPGTVPRASPTGAAAPAPGARRSTVTGAVIEQILPGVAVAAVVALALTALSGARTYARLGLPDPGALVTYGLPVVRALTESAAVVTVGALLLAAFLAPPPGASWLAADGYRAVRLASWAAAGWAAGALVTSVLAVADAFGRPLGEVLTPTVLRESWGGLPTAQAWQVTAFVALVCCGLARVALAWPTTVAAFALAVVGLLPVALTGHSATGGAHDLAVNSLVLHVSAAALWVGGLVAVLVHTVAGGSFTTTALRRFSTLALGCWVVLAATGLVNALLRVPPSELLRTTYGLLVLAKVAGLAVLGLIGARHRSHTLPAVAAGSRAGLVRLGGVEVLVMFATVGVAVALGRTPPPETSTPLPSRVEALLGYGLDRPLDLPGLVTAARPDLLLGTGAVVAALAYLVAVRRAGPWNRGHTTAWLAGCAVLLAATSSGIGRYAPAQFSVHMGQQVAVGVVAPLLLVLGRPGRLVRAVTRPAAPGGSPGPREWGPALRASWAVRGLTSPVVATVLLVGSGWLLDAGGGFDALVDSHVGHLVMTAWMFAVGSVFAAVVLDPGRRTAVRAAMAAVAGVAQAALGWVVLVDARVIGAGYWAQLGLPWIDRVADQRVGGVVLLAGALPYLAVWVAVVLRGRRGPRSAEPTSADPTGAVAARAASSDAPAPVTGPADL
jgi:cytochrome c oxidase assembly factor CtaG/putative copper export protein